MFIVLNQTSLRKLPLSEESDFRERDLFFFFFFLSDDESLDFLRYSIKLAINLGSTFKLSFLVETLDLDRDLDLDHDRVLDRRPRDLDLERDHRL